jgi:DNA polymerase V
MENIMMLQRINEEHNYAMISVLGNKMESSFLNEFSKTDLPSCDTLSIFNPATSKQKYDFDSTCLIKFAPIESTDLSLPYFINGVSAGYPSDVDDPYTRHLDLTKYLIRDPESTYYYTATGDSMVEAGITPQDILVVDTALNPKHRDVVMVDINGEQSIKRIHMEGDHVMVFSDLRDIHFVTIDKHIQYSIQGVVTTIIRTFNPIR